MNRWSDQSTEWTDKQTGWTGRCKDAQVWMDQQTDLPTGRTDRGLDGRTDRYTNWQTDGQTDGCMEWRDTEGTKGQMMD